MQVWTNGTTKGRRHQPAEVAPASLRKEHRARGTYVPSLPAGDSYHGILSRTKLNIDRFSAKSVFVRVVEAGNFARAAEIMDRPKPTVIRLIQSTPAYSGLHPI